MLTKNILTEKKVQMKKQKWKRKKLLLIYRNITNYRGQFGSLTPAIILRSSMCRVRREIGSESLRLLWRQGYLPRTRKLWWSKPPSSKRGFYCVIIAALAPTPVDNLCTGEEFLLYLAYFRFKLAFELTGNVLNLRFFSRFFTFTVRHWEFFPAHLQIYFCLSLPKIFRY